MKKRFRKAAFSFAAILFIAGAGLFLYPIINGYTSHSRNMADIAGFESTINNSGHREENNFHELYEAVTEYNEEIFKNAQRELKDQYSYQKSLLDLTQYGFDKNVFGWIEIPAMEVKLPIYLGATKKNMSAGAVHLTYTSLPMDQNNTNAVIAAHRGWNGAPLFKHIDVLVPGDSIIVTNPWSTLTYKVTQIKIIEKDDVEQIRIREGEKMLTLSTCHPYRVNTQRYLVFARLEESQ